MENNSPLPLGSMNISVNAALQAQHGGPPVNYQVQVPASMLNLGALLLPQQQQHITPLDLGILNSPSFGFAAQPQVQMSQMNLMPKYNQSLDHLSYQLLLQQLQLQQHQNLLQAPLGLDVNDLKGLGQKRKGSDTISLTNSERSSKRQQKTRRRRTCTVDNCEKLAQGRSTLCFAHGGGYRCQFKGCQSGARGCTSFCIKHGGGLRCNYPGCKSSARGKARLCISHGGGKRCSTEGCDKAAQGATSFCKRHLKDHHSENGGSVN